MKKLTKQITKSIVREITTSNEGFKDILNELETEVVSRDSRNHNLMNLGYFINKYQITVNSLLNAFEKMNRNDKAKLLNLDGYEYFIFNLLRIFERALKEKDIPVVINEEIYEQGNF